jgi:hypothetical protein
MMLTEAATEAVQGNVHWWAHSVFVPQGPGMDPQGATILQFHGGQGTPECAGTCGQANFLLSIMPQTDTRPNLIFHAFTAGISRTNPGLDIVHGQYHYNTAPNDPASGYSGQCLYSDYQPGFWYDFVHRIKWSYTDDGSHEIWMRKVVPGQANPVKKVLHRTGINTLYYNGGRAHLKVGVYHRYTPESTSVIIDRIRRSSLSGAAGADAVRMPNFTVDLTASVTNPDGTLTGCPSDRL